MMRNILITILGYKFWYSLSSGVSNIETCGPLEMWPILTKKNFYYYNWNYGLRQLFGSDCGARGHFFSFRCRYVLKKTSRIDLRLGPLFWLNIRFGLLLKKVLTYISHFIGENPIFRRQATLKCVIAIRKSTPPMIGKVLKCWFFLKENETFKKCICVRKYLKNPRNNCHHTCSKIVCPHLRLYSHKTFWRTILR